jgi:DNA-binding response OmpR family regulator
MAKRILVVEDDPSIRELLSATMLDEGYEVVTAENGSVALDNVGAFQPDVILLDLVMPIMNGPMFLELYRQRTPRPARIIVMTASKLYENKPADYDNVEYVKKPFDLNELIATVKSLHGPVL